MPLDAIADLIHILALLTGVQPRQKGERMSYKHALPSNVVNMASTFCVHTGERLCKRGLRHALDNGTSDIFLASITLAKHYGKSCVIIDNDVPCFNEVTQTRGLFGIQRH